MKTYIFVLLAALMLLAFGCVSTPAGGNNQTTNNQTTNQSTQLANPASEFCIKSGGKLTIFDEPDGQVGFCTFTNSTTVEEWNYFRAKGNLSQPVACTMEYAPVCGYDNKTYSNTCVAHAAGAAVKTTGECGSTPRPAGAEGEFCGGIAGFPCQAGLYCRLDGTYPDAGGKCVKAS